MEEFISTTFFVVLGCIVGNIIISIIKFTAGAESNNATNTANSINSNSRKTFAVEKTTAALEEWLEKSIEGYKESPYMFAVFKNIYETSSDANGMTFEVEMWIMLKENEMLKYAIESQTNKKKEADEKMQKAVKLFNGMWITKKNFAEKVKEHRKAYEEINNFYSKYAELIFHFGFTANVSFLTGSASLAEHKIEYNPELTEI